MKRRLLLLSLASVFLFPGGARAVGSGVYVAPKFVYGYTLLDQLKVSSELAGFINHGSAIKHDDAFGGALAVGYNFDGRFNLPLRVEIEYAAYSRVKGVASGSGDYYGYGEVYTDHFGVKQELDIQTIFLNAYYDFKTGTPFTPWLGAGLGAAFVHGKSPVFYDFDYGAYRKAFDGGSAQNTTNLAGNVGAGLGWRVAPRLTVDLGYRFVYLGEVKNPTWNGMIGYTPVDIKSKAQNIYMHQALLALRFEF